MQNLLILPEYIRYIGQFFLDINFSLKVLNIFMRLKSISHENNSLVLCKKDINQYTFR